MNQKPWLNHYDAGVPGSIDYPNVPLFQFLEEAAARFPDRPCSIFEDQPITNAQMNALVDRLAAGLERLGVKKGDRVGIFLPNTPQFILVYYAILKAGGAVVAVNPLFKQRELEVQLANSGASMIIGLSAAYPLLKAARPQTEVQTILLTKVEDAFELVDWLSKEAQEERVDQQLTEGDRWLKDVLLAQPVGAKASAEVTSEDVAIYQYSGGTTGVPKSAVALHRNLVANSYMFRHWLVGFQEGQETSLLAIPMYHVYGMVVGMSISLLLRSRMVLIANPRDLPNLLENIEKYQATFFPGVPTMYALINQNPDVQAGKYNLRSIRACLSGSAPLLLDIKERFESLTGAQLMEGYGLSEAPTATHCNPLYGEKRTGSIGLPLPDVDCRIVSLEDGETDLQPGQIGELLVSCPQMMKEYHNMPDETRLALRDGWLYTGDIAWMDSDGYFYIIDRKKEMIKVSGFQVWPREIEEVIATHKDVLEVSVAGVPDAIHGEIPRAWVVLKPGAQVTQDEIRSLCKQLLSYYKVPKIVEFRNTLPRTTVGKTLRRELVRETLEALSVDI